MTLAHLDDREFIERLSEFIVANLEDESLCVKEIAAKSGMSAHALNRRLHSINTKHLSQFIREVRLQKAFELLRNGTYTAAEVAYRAGFSSPAYFNKCFHDFYGYPPGKISGMGSPVLLPAGEKQSRQETKAGTSRKKKWLVPLLSTLLLAITAFVAVYVVRNPDQIRYWQHKDPGAGRLSLAVFPFRNMTNDSSWNIWQEGVQACLINALSNSGNILVRSEESINSIISSKGVTSYASLKPEIAGNISQKLEAGIYIYGNISKAGNTVRLNAELINSGDESVVSSFHIDGSGEKILEMIDSLSVLIINSVTLSELRKVKPEEIHDYNDYTVKSPQAYEYFIYGNLAFYRNDFTTAKDWYFQALAKDSTFYKPMARLALAYYNESDYEQGKEWCRKYCLKKDLMNMRDRIAANSLHALFFGTYFDRIKYLKQLLDLDDQNPMTWFNIGDCYYEMMEYEKAIPEFEKALALFHKFGTTPYWGAFYYELGISYHKTGQYNKEKKLYKKAEEDFPNDPGLLDQQAWLELSEGNNDAADGYLEKWQTIRKEEGWSEAQIAGYMAYIYSMAGMPAKEEQCYRKALALEPEKASRLNSLAYFLIDKGTGISEGLALAEKALQLYPDNYNSMHIKGYAFYKQGKYPEAIDWMQKSWNLRLQKSIYHHRAFLQLEEAKKAVFKS